MSENTQQEASEQEADIYFAEDLRNTSKNKPQFAGSVPQSEMEKEGRFILRPFNGIDRKILNTFDQCVKFNQYWKTRPARGVYILGDERENIISGQTPFIDDVPALQSFYLEGEGVRYIDLDNLTQSNRESAVETMNPRLIFKVLRGSKVIVHKDGTGWFASTGDLVNAEVTTDDTPHTLSTLFLFCNSLVTSYYMQRIVYSGSTETSRNLDAPYIQNIPIPTISSEEADILDHLVDYVMFARQYVADMSEREGSLIETEISAEFYRIAELTASNIYLEVVDRNELLEILEASMQTEIQFEQWADTRFSTQDYPEKRADEYWATVKGCYKNLQQGELNNLLDNIESSDQYNRVETVLNS
jgi:hypothetical protein